MDTSFLEQQPPSTAVDPAADAHQPAEVLPPRPRLHRRRWLREIVDTVIIFVVVAVLMNLLTARFIVDGPSMLPNFTTGQYVIVNRIAYLSGQPQRGDVVVVHSLEDPEIDLIKRVIGLPGETVAIHDNRVHINGTPLDEPYINARPNYQGEWTLAADQYFLLGDNRTNSRDSHNYGPLSRTAIIGQAAAIYWPPEDWRVIAHHTYATPEVSLLPATAPVPGS